MRITLKLFASLADYLPSGSEGNQVAVETGDRDTVADVLARFRLPERQVHLVLVNGIYLAPQERVTRRLDPGDHLAVWPPIAGG